MGRNEGHLSNCSSAATVTGSNYVGGISGTNKRDASISNCSSTATVTARKRVGGIVGQNSGDVMSCHSDATVSAYLSPAGGIAGWNEGNVTNCYSTGSVSGDRSVGGLVGHNRGNITTSYTTSAVTGNDNVGGLIGDNYDDGSITTSYWDVQTSGRTNMCGLQREGATGCDDSFGLTTAEMQTASTFLNAGWDFVGETANGPHDIWCILDGQDYPALAWESRARCASFPYPQHGTVDISQPLVVGWQVGIWTTHHDVYFGENEELVALATTEGYGGLSRPTSGRGEHLRTRSVDVRHNLLLAYR